MYHDNVSIEIFTDIDVAFHDGVVCSLMNTSSFLTKNRRLEQSLWSTETFISNSDDLTVGKFVGLFETRGLSGSLDFLFKVESDVA